MSEHADFAWISVAREKPLGSVYLSKHVGKDSQPLRVARSYWISKADLEEWAYGTTGVD